MTLTKFEINDICNVQAEPFHTQLKKSNELLERIAVALEQENSTINLLSETEKEFLKENSKPRKPTAEIMGEITRKYINKFNKKLNKEKNETKNN
jgi:lysyl-tRNA synthetase class I